MKIKSLFYSLVFISMVFFTSCSKHKEALKVLPNELSQANECLNENKSFQTDCYDLISHKNSFAQLRLGIEAQSQGKYEEAFHRYTLAKHKGNFYANSLLADLYKKSQIKSKDKDIVLKLLKDVEDVDPIAAYKMSFYYKNKKNITKAMKLLKFASENGLKKAQYELYKIYSDGNSPKMDIEKSKYWFKQYEENRDDFMNRIYGV